MWSGVQALLCARKNRSGKKKEEREDMGLNRKIVFISALPFHYSCFHYVR
jgi:hypothetical protein